MIKKRLRQRGEVTTAEVVQRTGLSRTYVHRILQRLQHEGRVRMIGKANRARYVLNEDAHLTTALAMIRHVTGG